MNITHEEWEDSLRGTRFPFVGTGDIETDQGNVVPRDLVLDAHLYVFDSTALPTLSYIQVSQLRDQVTLAFDSSDSTDSHHAVLDINSVTEPLVDPISGDPRGLLQTSGTAVAEVLGWGPGIYTLSGLAVLPHTVLPQRTESVRGIFTDDAVLLTGKVVLAAGRGLRWTSDGLLEAIGDPFFGRTVVKRGITKLGGAEVVDGAVQITAANADDPTNTFRFNLKPSTKDGAESQLEISATKKGT